MENNEQKWEVVGTTGYKLMHHGWKRGEEQFRNQFSFGLQYDRATVAEKDAEEVTAFIVRAVNSHDALKDAVKMLLGCMHVAGWEDDPAAEKARTALVLAGEKP